MKLLLEIGKAEVDSKDSVVRRRSLGLLRRGTRPSSSCYVNIFINYLLYFILYIFL